MKLRADHARAVDAWLEAATPGVSGVELVAAFDGAFRAIWDRGRLPLGEIMLAAVMERVLHDQSGRHPFLRAVTLEPDGPRIALLATAEPRPDDPTTTCALREVLVDFLAVLGSLTDDIITPSLHASLAKLATDHPRSEGTDHGEAR